MLTPMNARARSSPTPRGRRESGPQGTAIVAREDLPVGDRAHGGEDGDGAPALVGLTPPFAERRFPLHPVQSRIGRSADNTIVIDDPGISSEHARIDHDNGHWTILNALSTNGTFVNGRAVHEAEVRDGDRITLGNIAFEFRLREPEPGARPAAGWQRPGIILGGVVLLSVVVISVILLL